MMVLYSFRGYQGSKVIQQTTVPYLVMLNLLGDFGNVLALGAGDGLFVVGHLSATVRASDVGGTIGSTAADLRDITEFLGTGRNTHYGQPHMEEEGDETPQGSLVASVLGGRSRKRAAHFTREGSSHPELSERVQEALHLRRDRPETSSCANDQGYFEKD